MQLSKPVLLTSLILGLGACASAATGPTLLPSGWTPPTGQHCGLDDAPKRLPSLGEITDSATLVQQLAGQSGYGLFTLVYDSLGVADTARFVAGDLPHDQRVAWLRAVSSNQRERSPIPPPVHQGKRRGWSVLLRLDARDPASAQIGRSETCAPVLSNRLAIESYINDASSDFFARYPFQARPARLMVKVLIDSTGTVTSATPYRSTATPELSRVAQETAMRMRFLPARLNRVPVEVTAHLPVSFEARR